MFDLPFLLTPAFSTFFLGMLLRRTSVPDDHAVDVLFKLVCHLTLPALQFSVIAFVVIGSLSLHLVSALLIIATLGVSNACRKKPMPDL